MMAATQKPGSGSLGSALAGSGSFGSALARAFEDGRVRHESIPGAAVAAAVASELASRSQRPDCRGLRRIVEACYLDEVTPDDALLEWLLLKAFGAEMPSDDLLRTLSRSPGVRVSPKTSRKHGYVARLEGEPRWFRGFADEPDARVSISVEVWSEAASLLLQGGWPSAEKVPHERFTLAAWLRQGSEALSSLSFGRALHLVYHAINSKSVLGKRGGCLVPYPLSEDFEKQENAGCLRPTGLRAGEDCVSSWPEFQHRLSCLLLECSGAMAPSCLKRTFRARFGVELSETALGHTSMTSLLGDARFQAAFERHVVPGKSDMISLRA